MIVNPLHMVEVTPENVREETLFCIKDIKKPEFRSKQQWFNKRYSEGMQLKILKDDEERMLGFIEYIPVEKAWRPVDASNYMFIHCMYVYSKKDRNQGLGSLLIAEAEKEAREQRMDGICVMTSKGSWITNKTLFLKNDFEEVDKRGRFELLAKKWGGETAAPSLLDWESHQKDYKGWHLLYADQCPWHEKSVVAMMEVAEELGVALEVKKIQTSEEAKRAPSGFGVFALLHNGKLLEDHYLSATRFKTILKKELAM